MKIKEIVYTPHLKLRMKLREIENELPRRIYEESKEKYFDSKTDNYVAISKIHYKGKFREIAVIYEETTSEVKIITIHPLKIYEKLSKIRLGRWIKK